MTYKECIDFLFEKRREFSKPGLQRVEYMLKRAGNPEKGLRYVHIAGTNGKGSCATMTAAVLTESGLRTGLYTSPDVSGLFEGIRIDGNRIPDETLAGLVSELLPFVCELDEKGDSPTAFEIVTAAVFLWFFREKCDICVVECGMGGASDATNVIPPPEVSTLTNIALDHLRTLGETVSMIAENKAGIIKSDSDVIYYGGSEEAFEVIKAAAEKHGARLYMPDFEAARVVSSGIKGSVFSYKGISDITISLPGSLQVKNCCCALETVFALRRKGFIITDDQIRAGLKKVKMPGRFEVFSKRPALVYDGAHNVSGMTQLIENIKAFFPGRKISLIFGVMADKAHKEMLAMLKPYVNKLYAVTPDNKRALDRKPLKDEAESLGIEAETADLTEIIERLYSESADGDVIMICGSLYMYIDALPHIKNAVNRKENNMNGNIITVALDGPSGAGKSTVAKAISKTFGIGYLDTGAMYRTVALYMVRNIPELEGEVEAGGILPETSKKIVSMLEDSGIEVKYDDANVQHVYLGDEDVSGKIRTPLISMAASKVSAIPEVRVFLVDMQRKIGSKNSIVMDGRDIGTHVLPNASVKIFLTASPEERAKRRYKELIEKGTEVDFETVLKDIIDRDYGDAHRAASPLRQAEDAVLLDTTDLDLNRSVAAAIKIVCEKTGASPKNQ